MCEYVDSSSRTDNQPDGSGSIATIATTGTSDLAETRTELTPHVGHHSGYDLARPEELFRKEEIELYLDLMISHLEQLSSDSEMTDKIQVDDSHHHQSLPTLSDNELAQIRTFLILTTPTDSGMDRLHNQYRFVDSQVCLDHIKQLRPPFDPEAVKKAIEDVGDTCSAQESSMQMCDMSDTQMMEVFRNNNLVSDNGIDEGVFDISKVNLWGVSFFNDKVWWEPRKSHFSSLVLTGSQPLYGVYQTSTQLLECLFKNKQIQCLKVERAQSLLGTIKSSFHVQLVTRLRVLEFSLKTQGEFLGDIKQALAVLIGMAPGLRELRVVWNELERWS
ncbi:hypothetical protein BGX23_009853 [Mortierella sp. AD031]|nr:hypothetical protein BGX23_009853 [Mortierella sp. AD031]